MFGLLTTGRIESVGIVPGPPGEGSLCELSIATPRGRIVAQGESENRSFQLPQVGAQVGVNIPLEAYVSRDLSILFGCTNPTLVVPLNQVYGPKRPVPAPGENLDSLRSHVEE